MTLPDYVVFENIVLVLTKRLRSAFNFFITFFSYAPTCFLCKISPAKLLILLSVYGFTRRQLFGATGKVKFLYD
ncbi:hypothetical protein [Klebsiella pneumoniae IS39]|nr:hypothetical protein [Klebsiella pneumoniae IS39]